MSNVNVEDLVAVPKTEHSEDGSFSETSPEPDEQSFIQESAQVQKRKGGRKPVRNDERITHKATGNFTVSLTVINL